jgi:hypothetical protein
MHITPLIIKGYRKIYTIYVFKFEEGVYRSRSVSSLYGPCRFSF